MSDRGYSSMTLEDAKRISIVIGSQDSIESLGKHRSIVKTADPGQAQDGEHRSVRRAVMRIGARSTRSFKGWYKVLLNVLTHSQQGPSAARD